MKIKVLRHMLVDSNITPSRPGAIVDVDDDVAKELIANGTAEAAGGGKKGEDAQDEKAATTPANKKAPDPKNKGA